MEQALKTTPESSSDYVLEISKVIVRYAKGEISPEEYESILDAWWEAHKNAWQEQDLSRLFLLCCLK